MAGLPDAAPPPPPTYKNRRVGLVIFGVAEILIGLVIGLMIPATILLTFEQPPPNQPQVPPWAYWLMGLFYLALSSFFITVGLGSIRAKRWARIAMLAISWAWLAIGLLSMLVFAFAIPIMMRSMSEKSPDYDPQLFRGIMIAVGAVASFIYVGLPGIFLAFYSSKHVKATCEAALAGAPQVKPLRPLAISVVSWFFFVSSLISLPFALVMGSPAAFFGIFLAGWAARVYFVLWVCLYLYSPGSSTTCAYEGGGVLWLFKRSGPCPRASPSGKLAWRSSGGWRAAQAPNRRRIRRWKLCFAALSCG